MTELHDNDLGDFFKKLKTRESLSVPSFDKTLANPAPPRTVIPALVRLSFAAVFLILAGLFLFTSGEDPPIPSAQQLTQWQSPTDFLLRSPGDEVFRTVPNFGTYNFVLITDPQKENS